MCIVFLLLSYLGKRILYIQLEIYIYNIIQYVYGKKKKKMDGLTRLLRRMSDVKWSAIGKYQTIAKSASPTSYINRVMVYLKRPVLCLFSRHNNLCLLMMEVLSDEKPNGCIMKRDKCGDDDIEFQMVLQECDRDIKFRFTNFTPFPLYFEQFITQGLKKEQVNGFNVLVPYSTATVGSNANTSRTFRVEAKEDTRLSNGNGSSDNMYISLQVAGLKESMRENEYVREYDRFSPKGAYWSCVQQSVILESEILLDCPRPFGTEPFTRGKKHYTFGHAQFCARRPDKTVGVDVCDEGQRTTLHDRIISQSTSVNIAPGESVVESHVNVEGMNIIRETYSAVCELGVSMNKSLKFIDRTISDTHFDGERMLKEDTIGQPSNNMMETEEGCCICLENESGIVTLLPCAHTCICEGCLDRFIRENYTCPLCRVHIRGYIPYVC